MLVTLSNVVVEQEFTIDALESLVISLRINDKKNIDYWTDEYNLRKLSLNNAKAEYEKGIDDILNGVV